MPYPYQNSSSAFAHTGQYEYKTDTEYKQREHHQVRDNHTEDNKDKNNANDLPNDFFYGTEELLDTLPRPWSRSLLYLLIGFTVIVLPWIMLSKIDETGSARGRLEPLEATLRLDTIANGSVTAVKVKEGETVKAGQVLLELEACLRLG
jgi:hemolysin D